MADNYSRRLQYSNGQLLAVEDFQAEQKYHVDMRRRHNRLAHTWGILEGLDIEHAQGGMELVIKPGTAIDKDGQEIVLLGPDSEPLELKQKTSLHGTTFFLGLAYHDEDDPNMEAKDKNGKKIASSRHVERPLIQITAAAPATDGSVITLAKVTVDANGKVVTIDKSVRSRFAGLNPASDLSVRSLTVANYTLDDTAFQPLIKLLANQKDESASNAFTESKPSHGIEFLRKWNNDGLRVQAGIYAWGTGNFGSGLAFRTKAPGGNLSTRMVITDVGNVGVGVTDPKSALSVAGGLAVGANYAKTNAAPSNGLLVEGKVGIGTNDPAANALRVGAGSVRFELGTSQKLSLGGNGSFEIDKPGVVGGRFIVTDSGIGIGATNPTADLQFRDLVANSNVLICRKAAKEHDAGSVPSELALGTIDSCFAGVRIRSERKGTTANSQYICFDTHDAYATAGERMRITQEGYVGIGTAGPRGRLEVSDPAQAGAKGTITSSDKTVTGSGTEFDTKLRVGDQITAGGQVRAITAITSAMVLTIDSAFSPNITTATAFNFSRPVLLAKDGNVGIGTAAPVSKLHIDRGRVDITTSDITGGGQNRFDGLRGWNADAAYRRGQLVLSSSYSDLVIASSHDNNIHGSTLTFVTSNPTDATDYRKWVINQGNWGTRKPFLDFGYSDTKGRANPHENINNNDTVFTLDGGNKRVGIRTGTPGATLEVVGEMRASSLKIGTGVLVDKFDDSTLGNSSSAVPTAKAVRAYVDDQIAKVIGLFDRHVHGYNYPQYENIGDPRHWYDSKTTPPAK